MRYKKKVEKLFKAEIYWLEQLEIGLSHWPKNGGPWHNIPLSVLLTVHALAEFCDHINSKLDQENNQGRSQAGYSAGLNVFVLAIYRSTVI